MNKSEKAMEEINGTRFKLAPRLPLAMPLSISVTTANICNLECEFCAISEKGRLKNKPLLDLDTFSLFIERLKESKWHLKQIVLVGLGEPLINPYIVDFVKMAKESDSTDKVHIVTNAIALSHEMSDALINAGLDVLRVSINGLNGADYKKYTNRDIDYKQLIDNLSYFYLHKTKNMKLYVKIMDYMVSSDEQLNLYYDTFNSIADVVNVEYLTEMSTTIDYTAVSENTRHKGLKGFEISKTEICPLPFYHIYLNAEGTISACCVAGPWSTPPALVFGDIHKKSLNDIWYDEDFRDFLKRMLREGKNKAHRDCEKCLAYESYIYPEDIIDDIESRRILKEMEG